MCELGAYFSKPATFNSTPNSKHGFIFKGSFNGSHGYLAFLKSLNHLFLRYQFKIFDVGGVYCTLQIQQDSFRARKYFKILAQLWTLRALLHVSSNALWFRFLACTFSHPLSLEEENQISSFFYIYRSNLPPYQSSLAPCGERRLPGILRLLSGYQ